MNMIVSLVAMQAIISHRQYSKHDWLQKKYDVDMGPAGSTYLRYRYRKRARINIPLTHCPISTCQKKLLPNTGGGNGLGTRLRNSVQKCNCTTTKSNNGMQKKLQK